MGTVKARCRRSGFREHVETKSKWILALLEPSDEHQHSDNIGMVKRPQILTRCVLRPI